MIAWFTKPRIRALLYVVWTVSQFALANLNVSMFGDGQISWPEFKFRWVVFFIGLAGGVAGVLRAYSDQTLTRDKVAKENGSSEALV